MILSYNGFQHPLGQPKLSFLLDAIQNDGGQVVAYKARLDIAGKIITAAPDTDSAQADLSNQIQAIQEAYSENGGDMILLLDNGQQSPNSLINAATLGGTRIVRAPSFPEGGAGEYATQRNFVVAVEAELPTPEGVAALWSFKETMSFEGGGPATDWLEPLEGNPVPQTLKQNTAYRMIQQGEAVGYLSYWGLLWPGPRYPDLEQRHLRREGMSSPQRTGSGSNTKYRLFPTNWSYQHKSDAPFVGAVPTLWPI